jgi:hypothetical protein
VQSEDKHASLERVNEAYDHLVLCWNTSGESLSAMGLLAIASLMQELPSSRSGRRHLSGELAEIALDKLAVPEPRVLVSAARLLAKGERSLRAIEALESELEEATGGASWRDLADENEHAPFDAERTAELRASLKHLGLLRTLYVSTKQVRDAHRLFELELAVKDEGLRDQLSQVLAQFELAHGLVLNGSRRIFELSTRGGGGGLSKKELEKRRAHGLSFFARTIEGMTTRVIRLFLTRPADPQHEALSAQNIREMFSLCDFQPAPGQFEPLVKEQYQRAEAQAFLHACFRTQRVADAFVELSGRSSLAVQNDFGWQPLHYFVAFCDLFSVRALLARGANAAAKTSAGLSPLHIAALRGCIPVIRALLERDDAAALLALKDDYGRSPADLACLHGWAYKEVAAALGQHASAELSRDAACHLNRDLHAHLAGMSERDGGWQRGVDPALMPPPGTEFADAVDGERNARICGRARRYGPSHSISVQPQI